MSGQVFCSTRRKPNTQGVEIMTSGASPVSVCEVIKSRVAVRRFLPRGVPEAVVREILHTASYAPSGANLQPWRVYVVAGAAKDALAEQLHAAFHDRAEAHSEEYRYYPDPGLEPYASRKRAFGRLFYGALGIRQEDAEARVRQTVRNYRFFDAPVGLVFTIDRRLEQGSWLDYGMFLQSIMLAARAAGLDTCPQVSFAKFHVVLRKCMGIPENELVLCGMSLGYADPESPELSTRQPRIPVDAFASFSGFAP
ncbi:nitroreductase [Cupriavidus sp. 8B]